MAREMIGTRFRVAAGLYLAVALGIAGTSGVYLLSPEFMPYHAQVAGMTWAELPERLRWLLGAFQRGAGALGLSLAIAITAIAWFPLRRGERWARWTLAAIGLAADLPLLCTVRRLATSSGADVPLAPLAALSALLGAAMLASFWPARRALARSQDEGPQRPDR